MFLRKKKPATLVAITPKGRAYFTRKHIAQQVKSLGMFESCPKLGKHFDPDCVTDLVMAADIKGLLPVVSFIPRADAWDVYKGRALLVKLDVNRDDAGDNT